MAYCSDAEMNARYDSRNVGMWADLGGTWVKGASESAAMTARRLAARNYATAYIDAKLRTSNLNFNLPFSTVPALITDCATKLAGYWLSTASGVSSYDQQGRPMTRLYVDFLDAVNTLDQIIAGTLLLDV